MTQPPGARRRGAAGTKPAAQGFGSAFDNDRTIDLDAPATSDMSGDLTPEQLDELRQGLGNDAQMQTAAEVLRLLASQQQSFVKGLTDSSHPHLDGTTEELLMSKLGLAEANARLAQAGLTPIDSVEGKIKALTFVTNQVIEFARVGPRTRLLVERDIFDYRELLVTQGSRLELAALRSQNALQEEKIKQLSLQRRWEVQAEGAIADIELDAKKQDAGRRAESVNVDKQNIATSSEQRRLDREEKIQARRRENADRAELRRLFRQRWGRTIRWAFWFIVILVIVSNVVADNPAHADVPILSTINHLWDNIYMPIRDGIVHSVHHYQNKK